MVVTYSESLPIGSDCPDFSLPCTEGHTHSLESFSEAPVLVVVFMCNHCPFVLPIEEKLITLSAQYKAQGVQVVAINANDAETYPDDSFEKMKERSQEKQYPFPYLHDESQEVARSFHAQCTPDIFVYDQDRTLQYHGRIDDAGRGENAPTTNELREAIDALLAGNPVENPFVPSMGCNIKWK